MGTKEFCAPPEFCALTPILCLSLRQSGPVEGQRRDKTPRPALSVCFDVPRIGQRIVIGEPDPGHFQDLRACAAIDDVFVVTKLQDRLSGSVCRPARTIRPSDMPWVLAWLALSGWWFGHRRPIAACDSPAAARSRLSLLAISGVSFLDKRASCVDMCILE